MSSEVLPYTVEPHPVTGLYSGKFGIWLFLASEIMLFGGLFSTYLLLRVGAAEGSWPVGEAETLLSVNIGMLNTIVLIMSSITMVMAWAALKMKNIGQARGWLAATLALAVFFLVVKIVWEYVPKFQHDLVPATSTFYAIYFTLTGLHGLHIVGGIVVIGYFLLPGSAMWKTDPERFTNRIECTGLYWHFVDLVWIFLFPTLYLL